MKVVMRKRQGQKTLPLISFRTPALAFQWRRDSGTFTDCFYQLHVPEYSGGFQSLESFSITAEPAGFQEN